jgi:hypothetical protein
MIAATDRVSLDIAADPRARTSTGRERRVTAIVTAGLLAIAIAACGGTHGDTYARATDAQQGCCEHLAGDARTSCLSAIVRIEDAQVAHTSANQSTYACVTDYFTCDPTSGHATTTSAQAQLECIQDLH